MLLNKKLYFTFLKCRQEFWLHWNKPETLKAIQAAGPQDYAFSGEERQKIYDLAQRFLDTKGNWTHKLSVTTGQYSTRVNTYGKSKEGKTRLYKISVSTKLEDKKKRHIRKLKAKELAFHQYILEQAGYEVEECYLLYVNKHYEYQGEEIDTAQFFRHYDITAEVKLYKEEVIQEMKSALVYAQRSAPEDWSWERSCKDKLNCPYFQHKHPDLKLDFPIFKVPHLPSNRLELNKLYQQGILETAEIPEPIELKDYQLRYIQAAKTQEVVADYTEIANLFDEFNYPLYFLDYETVNLGVPVLKHTGPYTFIPFQFSLHILQEDGTLEHVDFIAASVEDSMLQFTEALHRAVPSDKGTVVVWNKHFEQARNRELGAFFPSYAHFFEQLNERVFDLMEIFSQHLYIDPRLRGSSSLKNVLPVLVPQLNYDSLEVKNGVEAFNLWWEIVSKGKVTKKEQGLLFDQLRAYCGLDTLAMVRIYQALQEKIK